MTKAPPAAPPAPLTIRRTVANDLEVLQGLHLCQLALAKVHRQLYAEDIPALCQDDWYDKLHCGNLSRWLQRGVEVLHAQLGEQVVGYVSFWPPRPGDDGPSVTINHIIVRESHRGRGIGRQLLDFLGRYLDAAHGVGGVCDLRLSLAAANTRALGWWYLLGFREEGRIEEPLDILVSTTVSQLEWIKLYRKPLCGIPAVTPPALQPCVARGGHPRAPAQPPALQRQRQPRQSHQRRSPVAEVVTIEDDDEEEDLCLPVVEEASVEDEAIAVATAKGKLNRLSRKRGSSEGHKDPWRPLGDPSCATTEGKMRRRIAEDPISADEDPVAIPCVDAEEPDSPQTRQ